MQEIALYRKFPLKKARDALFICIWRVKWGSLLPRLIVEYVKIVLDKLILI